MASSWLFTRRFSKNRPRSQAMRDPGAHTSRTVTAVDAADGSSRKNVFQPFRSPRSTQPNVVGGVKSTTSNSVVRSPNRTLNRTPFLSGLSVWVPAHPGSHSAMRPGSVSRAKTRSIDTGTVWMTVRLTGCMKGSTLDGSVAPGRRGVNHLAREHGEIGLPRPHGRRVLLGHDARDLCDVAQVVNHPRCEQLREGHLAQLGMSAAQRQLRRGQVPTPQRRHAFGAQLPESIQPAIERPAGESPGLRESVERLKRTRFPLREDDRRPRDPIGFLAVDQVAHHVLGTPRVGALVAAGPRCGARGARCRTRPALRIARARAPRARQRAPRPRGAGPRAPARGLRPRSRTTGPARA